MNTRSVALVCAGAISRAEITRVPNLVTHLGPIKAVSMRVASRAANTFRAGYPVQTYDDLQDASLVLVSAPADRAQELIDGLSQSSLDWSRKAVVLTGSPLDSLSLKALEAKDAATGSLHLIDFPGSPLCILEGDEAAFRAVSKITGKRDARLLHVRPGAMPACFAAICLSSHCFLPLIDACAQAFAESGIDPANSALLAGRLFAKSLRSYAKAGKNSWTPVPRDIMLKNNRHIRSDNAALASYYSAMFDLAGSWMQRAANQ